jgi:hypothetical protein
MIWILATRGASLRERSDPFTETPIEGVHSVVYKPGIETIVQMIGESGEEKGTFARRLHRARGYIYSYHGSIAEELLSLDEEMDLLVRYRAGNGQPRLRTLQEVIFLGDAVVSVPPLNTGTPELIGVPFRVQLIIGDTLQDRISDEVDE